MKNKYSIKDDITTLINLYHSNLISEPEKALETLEQIHQLIIKNIQDKYKNK